MPKFKATLFETLAHTLELEADDLDQAMEIANKIVEDGEPEEYDTESLGIYDSDFEEIK